MTGVPPSQQDQSEEAFDEIEGNANNQAQESRWISLLRSDKYGQLIETPKFRKFATDYIANQWRDLAIKGGYNHNSGMAMPCDRLTRGTICVPHLPEGDVILTRYPIVNSDNIRLYSNIHDPELKKTRNVVWIQPKDAEEYHQADFDGDQLMVSPTSKLPNIAQETLRAGEPGRFEPVKQRPKLAYTEITDEEGNFKYKNLAEIAAASSQNKVGLVATNIGRVQSSMPKDGENVERFGRRQRKLLNRLFQALQVEVDSPKSAERLEDIKEKGVPHKRQTPLTALADDCQLKPVSVLLRNEQLRVEQLKEAGSRQIWNQIAFCTWTSDDEAGSQHKDFVGGLIEKCRKFGSWAVEQITGNKRIYQEEFFKKLLLQGFQQGFIQWELLLNTKIGLEVTPCSATDLWEWLWNRFNEGTAPPIPQVITLKETETGLELTETLTTNKHICTLLIEGQQGRSACPEHRGDNDRVYLTGKSKVCGVMVVADPPVGWSNAQDQLKWVWKILASSYVHDTEAWIEISRSNDFFIQDNLARQAKQSKTARTLAITKGQGRDVGAEIKQEESFEAQRRLYEGTKALHCAPVFLVYRHSAQELTHACNLLANSFETAKVIRERNIAWEIWLQTLPITCKWLLHGGNLSERRITLDTHTVAGIMPLTVPKDIDKQGVEFLTSRGGKPI